MSELPRTEELAHFVEHAADVRAHPRFDAEERGRSLEVAWKLRSLFKAAQEGLGLRSSLSELSLCLSDPERLYRLTAPEQDGWLERWVSSDEASLRQALRAFVHREVDADARFVRFMEAVEVAGSKGLIERRPRVALTFGSLLNFALEPHSLPVVRVHPFARLEERLSYDPKREAPMIEQHLNHLAFARRLGVEMGRAGIPVRDMLDVQALIHLSALEEFWESGSRDQPAEGISGPDERRKDGTPYLSVCSCLGYDAPYLLEWIEFHRLVGVERFFLYNNGDREVQEELLSPYVQQGMVVLHDWPLFPPQLEAHKHCVQEHRKDSRWIAFIDTDEFLFSPAGRPLPEVLTDYEAWPGVGVNQALFGTNGHREKPPGLVIESYLQMVMSRHVKPIVDPVQVANCVSPHYFVYARGSAVDETFRTVSEAKTLYVSFARLRINHYKTKSEEEVRAKLAMPLPDYGASRQASDFDRIADLVRRSGQPDYAIQQYLPRLREVLKRHRYEDGHTWTMSGDPQSN